MKILWIPHAAWNIPQRAHAICERLADEHTVHVTDWRFDLTGFADLAHGLRGTPLSGRTSNAMFVHRVPRIPGGLTVPALRALNHRLYSSWVQRIVDLHRIDVVVGCFVADPPVRCKLILDVCDHHSAYWREYRNSPGYAREIEAAEAKWLERADAVVTVGHVLAERAAKFDRRPPDQIITVVPNGVDIDRFRSVDRYSAREALGIPREKKVVSLVGMFGEFAGLDLFVEAAAQLQRDDLIFLVVGDGVQMPVAKRIAHLHNLRSIRFVGRVPPAQVPLYLAATDVGVLSHRTSDFTAAACPIKLIEYAAAGCTAVSTDLTEVRHMGFPNVVIVADTARDLAYGIDEALTRPFIAPPHLAQYDSGYVTTAYHDLITSLPDSRAQITDTRPVAGA